MAHVKWAKDPDLRLPDLSDAKVREQLRREAEAETRAEQRRRLSRSGTVRLTKAKS